MLTRLEVGEVAGVTGGDSLEVASFIPYQADLPDGRTFNPWETLPFVVGNDHVLFHIESVRDEDIWSNRQGAIQAMEAMAVDLGVPEDELNTYVRVNGVEALIGEESPYASFGDIVARAREHLAFRDAHDLLAEQAVAETVTTLVFEIGQTQVDRAPEGSLTFEPATLVTASLLGYRFIEASSGQGVDVMPQVTADGQEVEPEVIFAIDTTGDGPTHYSFEDDDAPGQFGDFVEKGSETSIDRQQELPGIEVLSEASRLLVPNLYVVSQQLADSRGVQ